MRASHTGGRAGLRRWRGHAVGVLCMKVVQGNAMRGHKQLQENSGSKRGARGGWDGVGGLVIRDTLLSETLGGQRQTLEMPWDNDGKEPSYPWMSVYSSLERHDVPGNKSQEKQCRQRDRSKKEELLAGLKRWSKALLGPVGLVLTVSCGSREALARGFPWLISCPRRVGFGGRQGPELREDLIARRAVRTETFQEK